MGGFEALITKRLPLQSGMLGPLRPKHKLHCHNNEAVV